MLINEHKWTSRCKWTEGIFFLYLCYNMGSENMCFATSEYKKPYPTISKISCMTEKLLKYY